MKNLTLRRRLWTTDRSQASPKKLSLKRTMVLGMTAFAFSAGAQVSAGEWVSLEEAPELVDVSYRFVQCESTDEMEIHLSVFNESPEAREINFTLLLSDGDEKSKISSRLTMAMAEMRMADCDSKNGEVKFALPEGFDPSTTGITIEYGTIKNTKR